MAEHVTRCANCNAAIEPALNPMKGWVDAIEGTFACRLGRRTTAFRHRISLPADLSPEAIESWLA